MADASEPPAAAAPELELATTNAPALVRENSKIVPVVLVTAASDASSRSSGGAASGDGDASSRASGEPTAAAPAEAAAGVEVEPLPDFPGSDDETDSSDDDEAEHAAVVRPPAALDAPKAAASDGADGADAIFSPRGARRAEAAAAAAAAAPAAAAPAAAAAAAVEDRLAAAVEEPASAAPLPRLYLSHEHPAVLAAQRRAAATDPPLPLARRLANWLVVPPLLPLLLAWHLAALVLGLAAAFAVAPSLLLARRLYWALPFIPFIWQGPIRERYGRAAALLARLQFEGAHCATVVARLLTAPLRPHLPAFYIAGFPKCGTTSLAAYLRLHPDLAGVAGMPGHEALSKESHFLGGALGRGAGARAAALYASCFPSLLTRWWAEAVGGARRWRVFDATPTYACLPHAPARVAALTPGAKVIFMVREPTAAVFSAEAMLRGMGVPLGWSLAEALPAADNGGAADADGGANSGADADSNGTGGDAEAPRDPDLLRDDADHAALWARLASLPPDAPLPAELPRALFLAAAGYLASARYADRLAEWARHVPPEDLLVVDFGRFVREPEAVVREVLAFVGADAARYRFRPLPAGMATDYKGRRMHPDTRRAVAARWFAAPNAALARMLGLEGADPLGWDAAAAGGGGGSGSGGGGGSS